MSRPISPPITPAQAYFILGMTLCVGTAALTFAGLLYALSALAEAALPIVDRVLNWGG